MFCVDFRKLNALTVKSIYPVSVIDQPLDELHQASWFSKLDLRAGFHQILLQHSDEHKIIWKNCVLTLVHESNYNFTLVFLTL